MIANPHTFPLISLVVNFGYRVLNFSINPDGVLLFIFAFKSAVLTLKRVEGELIDLSFYS